MDPQSTTQSASLAKAVAETERTGIDEPAPATPTHTDSQTVHDRPPAAAEEPYSIYTKNEKWVIVGLVSYGCLFSPLTANVYLPSIPILTSAFHKDTELIDLTVTVYMVLQGVSPMVWGPLADRVGRRPVFLACLLVLALSCVGLALVPTSAYWLLLLLRCLQAAGSASTVALCSGVMGDIATRAERGGFIGVAGIGALLGPAIGPVIGGGLAQGLGWRSIFWFLCIASLLCFLLLFLVLPETLRAIVGNGSIPAPRIYNPVLPLLGRSAPTSDPSVRPPPKPTQNPFSVFTYPDVVTLLLFNAIVYSSFYSVLIPLSSLFQSRYPYLSQTTLGLCFLAIGGGMIVGTTVGGKVLDHQYSTVKARMLKRLEDKEGGAVWQEEEFPIERTRLQSTPIYLIVLAAAMVGYGWCLRRDVCIAVPLILTVIIGYVVIGFMNTVQTLIVDLLPNRGSSVTAANNLVRCSFGAATIAAIDVVLDAVGEGWTYVILGPAFCAVVAPLIWLQVKMGPVCRERRRRREERALERR